MTSLRQIEANRRNALKSMGPKTPEGKEASRCNAVRHGLTAETVIGALEDADDYREFEAAIIADYDAQSAVERELVLRLASLLWRLRRATSIETGLFEIQAGHLRDYRQGRQLDAETRTVVYSGFGQSRLMHSEQHLEESDTGSTNSPSSAALATTDPAADVTRSFLRLTNLPSYPLDRLSRYEASLWRQAGQILLALDSLDRRKPQDRWRRLPLGFNQAVNPPEE